ncbi:MAG: 7-cyano-7-deazaguanine synthase QueC [Deltaproteobacteria bacterium]|nr:7-cyano-7-deazaguanine synthase QueC [Deltaproteobacteria bacterium]
MIPAVVLLSGGLDSTTLLHYVARRLERQVTPLAFDYGQRHRRELSCAEAQSAALGLPLRRLDISALVQLFASSALVDPQAAVPDGLSVLGDPQPKTYVPNRNTILLALAAAQAETLGAAELYYGAQRHDVYGYWDTTAEFVERLNAVFALNRKQPVQVLAPLIDRNKTEILRLALELGVDLAQTWSCYQGDAAPCGRCLTCAERRKAFADLGLADPLSAGAQE